MTRRRDLESWDWKGLGVGVGLGWDWGKERGCDEGEGLG